MIEATHDFQPFFNKLLMYYKEFLETDFHVRRHPKRSMIRRNRNNLLVGVSVQRYPDFFAEIWKRIMKSFQKSLSLPRKRYTLKLAKNIVDILHDEVNAVISENNIQLLISSVAGQLPEAIEALKTNPQLAMETVVDIVREELNKLFAVPLLERLETSFATKSTSYQATVATRDELIDILDNPIEEVVEDIVKAAINGEHIEYENILRQQYNPENLRKELKDYLTDFEANDLFEEIKELVENEKILDKQELYLYFGEISIDNLAYPLFYIPLQCHENAGEIECIFDSRVFINEKAIRFVEQEYNKRNEINSVISELHTRVFYLDSEFQEIFPEKLQDVFSKIQNHFNLEEKSWCDGNFHQAKYGDISLTNGCHFAIFDKSDESLINDYEEILLSLADDENVLQDSLKALIENYLLAKGQHSVRMDIEQEWAETPVKERLVYTSPVPLNAEQRQILKALTRNDVRYVTVEGPPGTGKSHTITAIVCDAVLKEQSVLVLSDKAEALDVVEDKIGSVMDRIRPDHDFQNPILRLGRNTRAYGQIMTAGAIDKIRKQFLVVKNRLNLPENINKNKNDLLHYISEYIEVIERIKISDIVHLLDLEEKWPVEELPFDVEELAASDNAEVMLKNLVVSLDGISNILSYCICSITIEDLYKKMNATYRLSLSQCLKLLQVVRTLDSKQLDVKEIFSWFHRIDSNVCKILVDCLREYRRLGSGIFGYLFQGGKVRHIEQMLEVKIQLNCPIELRQDADKIEQLLQICSEIKHELRDLPIEEPIPLIQKLLLSADNGLRKFETQNFHKFEGHILSFSKQFSASSTRMGLNPDNYIEMVHSEISTMSNEVLSELCELVRLTRLVHGVFQELPIRDFSDMSFVLQELVAMQMTHVMDGRFLDFVDKDASTARTLKKIIQQKKQFPQNEFEKMRMAFPCILAGIRDYAEYIPLRENVFDLLIIDEASQVSIAQAFPAILRAKKILVLGDTKQFSNVKSSHARSETNTRWMDNLENTLPRGLKTDTAVLERLKGFNIRNSVLEFFEHISHFKIMLTKHFRGYRELISYSSKHFYNNDLQTVRIRSRSIDDTLAFEIIDHDGTECREKANSLEAEFILQKIEELLAQKSHPTVGIITPHTEQQKYLSAEVAKRANGNEFYEKLRLKIMTFDTCQGEERDIIFYSMVAHPKDDRLTWIFPRDLKDIDIEEGGNLKAQRLNVGLSRAREKMYFVLSKPLEEFSGSIQQALLHYQHTLEQAKRLPASDELDPNSPMEHHVLEWIKQTGFYQKNSHTIELHAQFPLGDYLKQLDSAYQHPAYRVDFLMVYNGDRKEQKIIIEYDGFREHFVHPERVNELNYEYYYCEDDIEREKILESYGYKFLRINKFNIGQDPVISLNQRLNLLCCGANQVMRTTTQDILTRDFNDLDSGNLRLCPKCGELRPLNTFKDKSLSTGMGRYCMICKNGGNVATVASVSIKILCPQCGSSMKKRTGRFGEFWGCSQFPNCKGTRKIN